MASSLESDTTAERSLFQEERCVFQIRRKGISQIERCDVRRVAPDTLDVECQAHPKELETKLRAEMYLVGPNGTLTRISNGTSSATRPDTISFADGNLQVGDQLSVSVVAINSAGISASYSLNHTVQEGNSNQFSLVFSNFHDALLSLQEWQPLKEETDVILLFDDDDESIIALGDPIRMIPIIGKFLS